MPKNKYLIAVSGGPDSMALLDMCTKAKLDVLVCHINYHWRKTSDEDEHLVCDYCMAHHLPIEVLDIDSTIYQTQKFNFENWARQIRYHFFLLMSKKYQISDILIAHHLNDWLETAIMQKQKKVKTTYFGIRKTNQFEDIKIIRPLINWTKQKINDYCKENQVTYIVDQTNFDPKYQRNKIRLEIAHWSEYKFWKEVSYFINQNKRLATIDKKANQSYQKWLNINFELKYFKSQSKQLQIELIYQLLNQYSPQRVSLNKINAIIDFIKSDKAKAKYRINRSLSLAKVNKHLIFVK